MTTLQNIQELAAIERQRYMHWQELLAEAKHANTDAAVAESRRAFRSYKAMRDVRANMGLSPLPWHTEEQRQKYEAKLAMLSARGKLKRVEVSVDRALFKILMGRDYDPVRDRIPTGAVRSVDRVLAELRARGELNFARKTHP